jgi:hypothetical protein
VAALTVAAKHLDQQLDALAVLANVMAIASWVFLWRPIEALVFKRWERRQDRRALPTARDHTDVLVVPIEPDPDAEPGEADSSAYLPTVAGGRSSIVCSPGGATATTGAMLSTTAQVAMSPFTPPAITERMGGVPSISTSSRGSG